jgi:hypothetical protein
MWGLFYWPNLSGETRLSKKEEEEVLKPRKKLASDKRSSLLWSNVNDDEMKVFKRFLFHLLKFRHNFAKFFEADDKLMTNVTVRFSFFVTDAPIE